MVTPIVSGLIPGASNLKDIYHKHTLLTLGVNLSLPHALIPALTV